MKRATVKTLFILWQALPTWACLLDLLVFFPTSELRVQLDRLSPTNEDGGLDFCPALFWSHAQSFLESFPLNLDLTVMMTHAILQHGAVMIALSVFHNLTDMIQNADPGLEDERQPAVIRYFFEASLETACFNGICLSILATNYGYLSILFHNFMGALYGTNTLFEIDFQGTMIFYPVVIFLVTIPAIYAFVGTAVALLCCFDKREGAVFKALYVPLLTIWLPIYVCSSRYWLPAYLNKCCTHAVL